LDSGEFDEAHEVYKQLVISCCDTPELLELIEKALDEIALFIEINVIGTLDFAVAFGRDDDFAFACGNLLMQVIGIVAFVGDGGCGGKSVDEFVCMGDIVLLSGAADQPDRIAQGVSRDMDFGAQTPSGAAQALGMRPPFFLAAPAAC
jgi:hypothetical protein